MCKWSHNPQVLQRCYFCSILHKHMNDVLLSSLRLHCLTIVININEKQFLTINTMWKLQQKQPYKSYANRNHTIFSLNQKPRLAKNLHKMIIKNNLWIRLIYGTNTMLLWDNCIINTLLLQNKIMLAGSNHT